MKFEQWETRLERLAPPGYNYKSELKAFLWLLIVATVYSLLFFNDLADAIASLYTRNHNGIKVLHAERMSENFIDVVDGWFRMFPLSALIMLLTSALHYLYFFTGSKSIYTMRRLPDRWDLLRRTVTLPVLCAALTMLLALALLLLYYLIYHLSVPKGHMNPGQGHLLMDWLLGGWRDD